MHSPVATQAPPATPRLAYIDNLRIALTALVVLHHVAVTYGNIPVWYYVESAQDGSGSALDALVMLNQAFFMGFFFMISGYFVPGSYARKGSKSFMRGRWFRLGIPLVLFLLVLRPVVTLPIYLGLDVDLPYWLFYLVSWDPGPMWFVEVLLVFCLGYLLLRRIRPAVAVECREPAAPPAGGIVAFAIGLALASYAWGVLVPVQFVPVLGIPSLDFLPQYVSLFIVGVLAYRRGWFESLSPRATWWGLAVAVVTGPLYLTVVSMDRGAAWNPLNLLSDTLAAAFAVGMILFGLGLFRRVFDGQRAFGRFLSQNAFAVYFVHPLVLVAGALALSGWEGPAIAKFAALAVIGLPACWLAAAGLRLLPAARKVL